MLTESQQDDAREALEEFVSALTSDPVRIGTKDLHMIQTILASFGLTIDVRQKPPAPVPAPSILGEAYDGLISAAVATGRTPNVSTPARAQTSAVAGKLTPIQRSMLNTAERAALDMKHLPGYCFKAAYVLDLVKIAKSLAGEV